MSGFPFEPCPTAVDLVRYAAGDLDRGTTDHLRFISHHLSSCGDCERAVEQVQMHGTRFPYDSFHHPESGASLPRFDELDEHVAAQRALLSRVFSSTADDPQAGDVWVTTYRRDVGVPSEAGLPWLLLVLDSYWREYNGSWVVDAVPVTEDPQIAADWSFVLSEEHNDFGMTIVAHLDFQFTTSRQTLQRRLGRLAQMCFECVRLVVRAYEVGDGTPQCQTCGALGTAAIRSRPDWLALDAALNRLLDEAMISFDDERQVGMQHVAQSWELEAGAPSRFADLSEKRRWEAGCIRPAAARREWPTTHFDVPTNPETGWQVVTLLGLAPPASFPPPSADTHIAADVRTLGEALHLLLRSSYNNDLQEWCARTHQSVSWNDLGSLLDLPIEGLLNVSAVDRIKRLRKSNDVPTHTSVYHLLNEAVDFLNNRLVASEGLGQRAARRQTPFHRPQG